MEVVGHGAAAQQLLFFTPSWLCHNGKVYKSLTCSAETFLDMNQRGQFSTVNLEKTSSLYLMMMMEKMMMMLMTTIQVTKIKIATIQLILDTDGCYNRITARMMMTWEAYQWAH